MIDRRGSDALAGQWNWVAIVAAPPKTTGDLSNFWCRSVLNKALAANAVQFPRYILPLGVPLSLSGGKPIASTDRLVLFLVSDEGRIGSFCVGVPDAAACEQMLTDAKWCRRNLWTIPNTAWAQKVQDWKAHCGPRLNHFYARLLDEADFEAQPDAPEHSQSQAKLLLRMDAWYRRDTAQRFGLDDVAADDANFKNSNADRIILEQHAETRHNWCLGMMPVWSGKEFSSHVVPIIATLWQRPFATGRGGNEPLQSYIRQQIALKEIVVLRLGYADGMLAMQALANERSGRRRGRKSSLLQVRKRLEQWPLRNVSLDDLVALQKSGHLPNLDLVHPHLASDLVLAPEHESPSNPGSPSIPGSTSTPISRARSSVLTVRIGDVPSRLLGQIRQLASTAEKSSQPNPLDSPKTPAIDCTADRF
ncbi:MAG: hypothetical protein AAF958_01855 [Planctomycetota bacterium]